MQFLVIGGDAAGMSAASRAKRNAPDLQVTVLEKTEDVSYSACGMPYNVADPDRDMDELVVRRAEVFRDKQGIDLRTGHTAETIDRENRRVSGHSRTGEPFSVAYDALLIATGAAAILPEVPGADCDGVMALKDLADGRRIKNYLTEHPVTRAVIIGMGYIGLEMAEALHERGIAVTMAKPRPQLLPWMEPDLAAVVRQEMDDHQVRLETGFHLEKIEPAGNRLALVGPKGVLEAEMVLSAIGVRPNSAMAAAAGLELGPHGELAVDRQLRTSDPDIYAAGDCADAYDLVTGNKTWKPLALRANRAGRAVGDNVCGKNVALPGISGTSVFKVVGLEVARTGLNETEAATAGFKPAKIVMKSRSRAHGHPGNTTIHVQMVGDTASGRLLGVQMVGREGVAHRINAPATALCAEMSVERFAQSDLAYAPPFSPVWDPLLTAANLLLKKL